MQLDQTFLWPHSKTLEWWRQRDKCRSCAHLIERAPTQKGSRGMRCAAVVWADIAKLPGYEPHPNLRRRKLGQSSVRRGRFAKENHFTYCIDARMEGSPCGPDARLYIANE